MLASLAVAILLRQPLPHESFYRQLAADTWHCISRMAAPDTGLPYDNTSKGEFTSVSNIGFYLSSVAAAHHLHLIGQAETDQRLEKCIASLEKLNTTFGFQQCWNSVVSLKPNPGDTAVSILDSGNLAASLLAVAHAEPKFGDRCEKLFKAMDWGRFYDPAQHVLLGGYDVKTGIMNPKWHLDLLGTDAQLAQFFAVATGGAPAETWANLNRTTESRAGFSYMIPGWQGGGLFMQYISGLWLDEQRTPMGESAENFAKAQIAYAKQIDSPVWGWSASDNPDGGYLGWGGIKDEVVTPHACVLPIEYMPSLTYQNLKELEKLGARSPEDGFYDALNWKTGKVSASFLVLDQGMLFLSLANYLDHGFIRDSFQRDLVVQHGRNLIADFRK